MRKTKEVKQDNVLEEIIKFTSAEDAEEFRKVASGRKFCKKGERIQDICDEEIERYEYEHNAGLFSKIFKHHKFKKNKEKLMLENRISSIIRSVVVFYINDDQGKINRDELVLKVKKAILKSIEKYKVEER